MRYSRCLISGAFALAAFSLSAEVNLPKVIILGKQYYCYEAKKGDSLFGISNRFGWDTAIVSELNPNVGSPIDKGTLIYYPVTDDSSASTSGSSSQLTTNRVTHLVQSGETVYSISRAYGIPMDTLYALNPSARNGIRTGETLLIAEEKVLDTPSPKRQDATLEDVEEELPAHTDDNFIYHTVASGETLYEIARKYDTRIEDIYRSNPGVSPDQLQAGETLRIQPGTRGQDIKYETSTEDRLVSVESYKVVKGDTWASVARKFGVDQQMLRDANPGKWKLKKGDIITVPVTKEVEVELAYHEEDPREQTPEGQRELYDEVHSIDATPSGAVIPSKQVKVAIVLEDTSTNRDMEFARGALLAVDRMKNEPFKSSLTILDGADPMSKVLTQIETFQPDVIISTSDKTLPQYLVDYSQRTSTELVNAFDLKSEAYIDTPTVFQFLTPSSYFNDEVRDYIVDRYKGWNLIMAGDANGADQLADAIGKAFGSGSVNVGVEEIGEYPLDAFGKYLIYATPVKKDDVSALLDKIKTLKDSNPLAQITVVGRPNWITFAESLSQKMQDANVLLPSRFYFDASDPASRRFIDDYQGLFGQTPMKSYPVYSVSGYDIMTYFVPNISATDGDYNSTFTAKPTLQSAISLERVSNWSGLYNPNCYLLEYSIAGKPLKIILPAKR